MKNPMMAIALGLTVLIASCSGETTVAESVPETPAATVAPVASPSPTTVAQAPQSIPKAKASDGAVESEIAMEPEVAESYPEIGQILSMQAGDLKCYAVVRDRSGQEFDIGATFEVCEQEDLLNQTVRFVYSEENVADCQSAEPCGRTRRETLISELIPLGESWQVLSNGTWTVTVGRVETWDGVNNTGNLTYYGCDEEGNCLSLTDGFVVCRNGVCNMSWANGNYAYTLSAELSETGEDPTTLLVWEDGNEILRAENMEIVDSNAP